MKHTKGIERLRTLYAMLAGIPDERIDLRNWRNNLPGTYVEPSNAKLKRSSCGTAACAVGWACAYPPLIRQGLSWTNYIPTFKDGDAKLQGWSAVRTFFECNLGEAEAMFSTFYKPSLKDDRPTFDQIRCDETGSGLNDAQKVMRRIRRYLMIKGAITAKRNAELARNEGVPA